MSRELNKIFDVKSRQARRDILDKFDLSKDDKNKFLNGIESGSGESGGEASSIEYLDISGLNEEGRANMAYFASKVKLIYSHNALGGEIKAIGRPLAILGTLGMGFGPLNGSIAIEINRNDIVSIKGAINADVNPFESMGEELDAIPRITKEQFYSLE